MEFIPYHFIYFIGSIILMMAFTLAIHKILNIFVIRWLNSLYNNQPTIKKMTPPTTARPKIIKMINVQYFLFAFFWRVDACSKF
jgi:hypothetical protein